MDDFSSLASMGTWGAYAAAALTALKWLHSAWKDSKTDKRDEAKELRDALKAANDQIREMTLAHAEVVEKLNAAGLAKDDKLLQVMEAYRLGSVSMTDAINSFRRALQDMKPSGSRL
ncbi:hypothetical protein [Roseomonas chloroacetimidivorans]|uniref:hypothetical protein n=1 Tax=Roseomonas chloroacetimidivorans TaxID=1766656 RepID=UPI003C7285B9